MNTIAPCTSSTSAALNRCASLITRLPFDLARGQYAQAVRFGIFPNSLLQSARFERELVQAERLALGPWARQV